RESAVRRVRHLFPARCMPVGGNVHSKGLSSGPRRAGSVAARRSRSDRDPVMGARKGLSDLSHPCLKYWISRSCFLAASRLSKVPRFLRLFVFGSFLRE